MDQETRATVETPARSGATENPYVPPIDDVELVRRNQAAMRLLDAWEADEAGEADQRETLGLLKDVLGERRVASSRNLFP